MRPFIFFVLIIFGISSAVIVTEYGSCSEALCGPRVSKCMLIKSCNCSMTPEDLRNRNCTCCKDCYQCLGELFVDCCSCVGLCRPNDELGGNLSVRSSVQILKPAEDQLSLFELVTSEPLPADAKWTVKTFPALDPRFLQQFNITQRPGENAHVGANCTVAFLKQCLSLEKCETVCTSMGASSYRWFHTGCCECVGRTCINFGWLEGLCSECGALDETSRNRVTRSNNNEEL